MKLHIPFLQKKPEINDRANINFEVDHNNLYNKIASVRLNPNIDMLGGKIRAGINHWDEYFQLLQKHYPTNETRMYFTLKLLVKCIGGKQVISSTRSSISHGRMAGDLNKKQRQEYVGNMRYNNEYWFDSFKTNDQDPSTGFLIANKEFSYYSLFPMYANVMNCGEFGSATNILILYFFSLLNLYETNTGKVYNTSYTVTLCSLEGGDHVFNLVQFNNPLLGVKKTKEITLYADSFYRAVRTQKEFDGYLNKSRLAHKIQSRAKKIATAMHLMKKEDHDASFVTKYTEFGKMQLDGYICSFIDIDDDAFDFIAQFLEFIDFGDTIKKIHKEYYSYLHSHKEIPKY
ncbi:MAG: hypothetical protein EBV05_09880 [Cyanobacteria bacterium WB6_1B_304]|nr:hypothetical protein [Cyanobacteria bacterium WB6_1B_304]